MAIVPVFVVDMDLMRLRLTENPKKRPWVSERVVIEKKSPFPPC